MTYWRTGDRSCFEQFLKHPYTTPYAAVFSGEQFEEFQEALCADKVEPEAKVIWDAADCSNKFVECMMTAEQAHPYKNNLLELAQQVRQMGYETGFAVAKYLLTDRTPGSGKAVDYYQTFIEIN